MINYPKSKCTWALQEREILHAGRFRKKMWGLINQWRREPSLVLQGGLHALPMATKLHFFSLSLFIWLLFTCLVFTLVDAPWLH